MSVSGLGWHEVSFAVLPEGGDPADVFALVEDKIGYVTYGSLNWNPTSGGTLMALEIGAGLDGVSKWIARHYYVKKQV